MGVEPMYSGFVSLRDISRRETDYCLLRPGRESNPRVGDLQSPALPLGYQAVYFLLNNSFCCPVFKNFSRLTASFLELYSS